MKAKRVTPIRTVLNMGLAGRTGNQICQVGTTIAMAERYGTTPRFHDDWRLRHVYSLPDSWYAPPHRLDEFTPVESLAVLGDLSESLMDYLQDLRWWEPSMSTIRDVFRLAPEPQARIDRLWGLSFAHLPKPWGVVHVRRGDNVTNDPGTINCLPESYYREAMTVYPGVRSWMVFTDDPAWCRATFGGQVATVYDGVPRSKERTDEYQTEEVLDWIDHALMVRAVSGGAAFVMSNSSYALTAAVLADADEVVYPSYWYGGELMAMGARPDLLFPDWLASSWERLDVADPNPKKDVGP